MYSQMPEMPSASIVTRRKSIAATATSAEVPRLAQSSSGIAVAICNSPAVTMLTRMKVMPLLLCNNAPAAMPTTAVSAGLLT